MANTGDKVVSTQIIDHVDGQPSIVLSNGNWGVFDPKTNMYKDTGIKASPEDDSSAVKYYKLNNDTTPPEAPSQTGGWNTLASLNAALAQAEWSEDPLQTSSTNRYCWIATYGKENIVDTVATEAEGHLVFKPKFTRTNVRLWSNYANSPTIAVVGNEIIITNPDGTVIKQKFASIEAINDLTTLITSLQSQVDGAIYSYSMEGVPTMNTAPTTDWRLDSSGNPITDSATIADVYRTHVGDTYTDLLTYRSYRFSQTGSSSSNPSHYEWRIIEDDALSAALGEIARLGREKITVFTEQPNEPYKKGDMWLDGEVMLHAIQSSEVFNMAHWVQPYATQVELDQVKTALQSAATDATLAKTNLATLESNLTNMTGTVADAIKDNIISDTELMDLNAELKQLDIDQESLLTTVNYLLDSTYLPATPKATLQTRSNNSIAVGGSMDIYQAQISTMITDKVITAQERADYLNKFNTYKNDLKLLNEAISGASSAIEGELKRLADEKVDAIEIGGRNLYSNNETLITTSGVSGYTRNTGDYLNGFAATGGNNNHENYVKLHNVIKGNGKYTVSFEMRGTQSTPVGLYVSIAGIRSGWLSTNDTNTYNGRRSFTVDVTNYTELNNSVDFHLQYAAFRIKDIQVEKGTKATDWSPAPEDVQAEIDAAVIKATYWSIKASTPVIYKDANSATASGVHTPVTLNGELRSGTTTTQGGFISIQPNGGAESTATASPRDIAPTDAEGKTSYTVRLYEKADKVTLLDTMTIPVVFKGSSGINVAMSNEADVLPASPTGEVSDYADTGNVIRVFEGSNELAYTKPTTAIVKGAAVDISTKNVTNLITNGNFVNGTTGWTFRSNISGASASSGVLSFTGGGTLGGSLNNWILPANQDMFIKGHVLYNIATARSLMGANFYVGIGFSYSTFVLTDEWGTYSHLVMGTAYHPTYGARSGDTVEMTNVMCFDLTAIFGEGNEPTKEECDKIFGGYFEGTVPLSDVALGGNGTYQVYPSPTGITEGTKSVSGLACSFANASNMTTDSAKITFNINGLSSSGTPFEFSKTQNFSKSKIGADGADGEGGINVMITRQGSFRTYWRQIGDQGQILTVPEKVSEIIGGVEIGGVKYVQCKVLIYKGSVDVTASALADPTTLPKWYLNNVLMGSVTDTLNIPITHADGVDDEVRFEYTDTNAKNWEGV